MISRNVQFKGNKVINTNTGDITLDQNTSELIIRKEGKVLTQVNSQGFRYSEPSGTRRILIGAHPGDGHIVMAVSSPGVDVIDELT